jgi:hypothetical protein
MSKINKSWGFEEGCKAVVEFVFLPNNDFESICAGGAEKRTGYGQWEKMSYEVEIKEIVDWNGKKMAHIIIPELNDKPFTVDWGELMIPASIKK